MSDKLRFLLSKVTRKTWFRCAVFSAMAILAVALSKVLAPFIPEDVAVKLGSDSLGSLLNILATSMLTVAVFSGTTMVSSFTAVSNSATPRAAQLVVEDTTIQNTIATFIGAFLYSVIALIGLHAQLYGGSGRLVLFGFTVAILLAVVIALLRWMDYLSVLGRMNETITRVQSATTKAMKQRIDLPWLGGLPQKPGDRGEYLVVAPVTGFVQHVSMDQLQECAQAVEGMLHLHVLPGTFVSLTVPLVSSSRPLNAKQAKKVASAVSIGVGRTFDYDPRFGMTVMGEIATRALSPAVNDPGTVLDVLAATVKTVVFWVQGKRENSGDAETKFSRVSAPALDEQDLLRDVFTPIARYGAEAVDVGLAYQQALAHIRRLDHAGFQSTLAELSRCAIDLVVRAKVLDADVRRLRQAALEVTGQQ